jgi:hypothetical protein
VVPRRERRRLAARPDRGAFFLWLALLEAVTRGRLLLVGLAIGGAFLSRLPTIGAAAFFIVLEWERITPFGCAPRAARAANAWRGVQFGAGLLAGIAAAALYNQARFGSPTQFGYALIPGLMAEPIYRHGWMSLRYIPLRLEDMLLAMPRFRADWPFAIPRVYAMAFWVTTPAFAIIAFARWRSRLAVASAAAILCTCAPILLHGGPGYFQFGFRYSLDFMPFLMLLVASGMRGRVTPWHQALIVLSIAINLWGVIMINRFGLWTW